MPLFVNTTYSDRCTIAEIDRSRFIEREREIFRQGGLMSVHETVLCDTLIYTLNDVGFDGDEFEADYSYLDRATLDPAGLDLEKCSVYSGKVSDFFYTNAVETVLTAYVLEGIYATGQYNSADRPDHRSDLSFDVYLNGEDIPIYKYVAWLNALFDEHYCYRDSDDEVEPLPTAGILRCISDDRIYYWRREKPIQFSGVTMNWLRSLKARYENKLSQEFSFDQPLSRIVHLLRDADDTYDDIMCFQCFLTETIEHLSDRRYLALWSIFEETVEDPGLRSRAHSPVQFWPRDPFRDNMIRFLALVANKELRADIFGF